MPNEQQQPEAPSGGGSSIVKGMFGLFKNRKKPSTPENVRASGKVARGAGATVDFNRQVGKDPMTGEPVKARDFYVLGRGTSMTPKSHREVVEDALDYVDSLHELPERCSLSRSEVAEILTEMREEGKDLSYWEV